MMSNNIIKHRLFSLITCLSVIVAIIGSTCSKSMGNMNIIRSFALDDSDSSDVITEYSQVENCMFPMKGNITIWQTAYESGYDIEGEEATHEDSCAMDISSESGYLCAPFTGKITGYAPDKCNEIVFTSDNKVRVPTGELCRVSVYALHSSNTDIEEKMNVSYPQGTELIMQGDTISKGVSYSEKYGIHFDIQVVKRATSDFADNAAYNGDELHYNCFFINDEVVLNSAYARATVNANYDPYEGRWDEKGVFSNIDSNHSTLKVSIPISVMRDENDNDDRIKDPTDILIKNIEMRDKIKYIAKNYASLDYDSLSEWEKKVYDSATYEFCDDIPTKTPPETITVKFNAGSDAVCSENERSIIKNTCSIYEFPTPTKEGYIFEGWFNEDFTQEYTNLSEINEDIELFAKWVKQDYYIYNGHTYKLFYRNMNWTKAKKYCESLGGHLVTIGSQYEQKFIEQIIKNEEYDGSYIIGLYCDEDTLKWKWVDDSPLTFSNWNSYEHNGETVFMPDNYTGSEMFGYMFSKQTEYIEWIAYANKWDDHEDMVSPFICEWDYEGVDFNDELQTYNGHSYYVFSGVCDTWEEAQKYCEKRGGYLAVINDEKENSAVFEIMKELGFDSAYFGYTDKGKEGNWKWVSNDSSKYVNWNKVEDEDGYVEPNNGKGYTNENYAMFYFKYPDGTWNDGDFGFMTEGGDKAFICEWNNISSQENIIGDPNSDGKIDANDATLVLVNYSLLSTGGAILLTDAQQKAADVNEDSKIDASDATMILQYYSYLSTGGELAIKEFMQQNG